MLGLKISEWSVYLHKAELSINNHFKLFEFFQIQKYIDNFVMKMTFAIRVAEQLIFG